MFKINFFLFCFYCFVSGRNDLFLIHNYDTGEYSCVTNSSSAITWIEDDTNQTASVLIPGSESKWSLKGEALKTNRDIFSNILDSRWEVAPIIKTTKNKNANLSVLNAIGWYSDIIRLAFSLRIDKEAHIFLCDGKDISKSNCYWLLLGAWNGTKTAVRKCSKGQLSYLESQNKCVKNLVEYPKNYLTSKFWTHFEFYKDVTEKYFFLFEIGGAAVQTVLKFEDKSNVIQISEVFVHSKVDGLWKFHSYQDYFRIDKAKQNVQLEPVIEVTNKKTCINFFVFMCEVCKLKVSLVEARNTSKVVKEQIYSPKKVTYSVNFAKYSGINFIQWTEIRFISENVETKRVVVFLSTISEKSGSFWRISNFRFCHNNEFRRITSRSNLNCQMVTNKAVYNFDENKDVVETFSRSSSCPLNTLSLSCIPCLAKCGRAKVCENFGNGLTCTCSDGYYGTNCSKCNDCVSGVCSSINGSCICDDDYTGQKCNIEKKIIFDKPPEVKDIQYTSASISLNNFDVRGILENKPRRYKIQYKIAENHIKSWMDTEEAYISLTPRTIKIENLEPGTKYFVRSVILGESGKKFENDLIPDTEFTTHCDDVTQSSIDVQPKNTSAFFFISEDIKKFCSFEKYDILINRTTVKLKYIGRNEMVVDKLVPFTFYEIRFTNKLYHVTTTFQTTEGIPEKVRNLAATSISPTTIRIHWQEPIHTHGRPVQYIVEYQHISYIKCDKIQSDEYFPAITNTTETFLVLEKLKPSSNYSFSVAARNLKFRASPEIIYQTTPNDIYENDIPKLQDIIPNIYSVDIILSTTNCFKLGLFFINVTAVCRNEWCQNSSQIFTYNFTKTVYKFENLQPYSNYTLNMAFCDNVVCKNMTSRKFQTKPTIPNPVDLSVYTKNTSSISLRWTLSYPPTGLIESFKIKYGICGRDLQEIKIVGVRCQIWYSYNCFTINGLEKSQNYCIKVIAKNQNVDSLKETSEIATLTETEQATAPYDLNIKWCINNDLELKWKHPNQTNGHIKFFRIFIEPQPLDVNNSIWKILTFMHGKHQLVYQYNIKEEDIKPLTRYRVRIAADNGNIGKELSGEFFSPPSLPVIMNGPKFSVNEFKIEISVSLKHTRKIFLFASNNNNSKHALNPDLEKFENKFHLLPKYGIVCEHELHNISLFTFTIGDKKSVCDTIQCNPFLLPNTGYNITLLLINSFKNTSSYKILSYRVSTEIEKGIYSLQIYLLVIGLLLIITITTTGCLLYFLYKKKRTVVVSGLDDHEQIPLQSIPNDYTDRKNLGIKFDVESFEKYVKDSLESGRFLNQHEMILQSHSQPMYEELNKTFSYEYIPSYSENIHGIPMNGYVITKLVPLEYCKDFWEMIWKENVEHIVSIDHDTLNGTEQYWPQASTKINLDNFSVELISSQEFRYHKLRTFILSSKHKTVYVNQLHISSMFQNNLPNSASAFVPLFQETSKIPLKPSSPILIHSSSGMAESGFILLCDICIKTAKNEGFVDVVHVAQVLGNCKIELIKDSKYFLLAHLVILEVLLTVDTKIKNGNNLIQKEEILQQREHLNRMVVLDEALIKLKAEDNVTTSATSIYENGDTMCVTNNKLLLKRFPNFKNVLTTHHPNSHNLNNFWEMVQEHKVSVIVSFNEAPQDECVWLPSPKKPILNLPKSNITHKSTKQFQGYIWRTVQLEGQLEKDTLDTFSFTSWKPEANCPNDLSEFVKFCIETHCILGRSDSILVMCRDGVTATGFFLANLLNIEMITTENAYDICNAARYLKSYNTNFIKDEEQFLFLWDASRNYMKENELYEKR